MDSDNSISAWQQRVGELMRAKGHHDDFHDRNTAKSVLVEQRLLRAIGEVIEAAEVVKKTWSSVSTRVRVGDRVFGKELVDAIYRLFDLAYLTEVDLESLLSEKHAENALRPYRYGTAEAADEITRRTQIGAKTLPPLDSWPPLQPSSSGCVSIARVDPNYIVSYEGRGPLGVQYTLPLDFYEVAAGPSDSEGGEQ